MKPNFDTIPQELKDLNQWCLWKLIQNPGDKKPTKIPYQTNGKKASSTNKSTWSDYKTVSDILNSNSEYSGIGFFFSKDDPFCFIDLDNCIKDGEIEKWAFDIVKNINSYPEHSQSMLGIHIIAKAELADTISHRKNGFEIYTQDRYCAITGYHLKGFSREIESRQDEVKKVYNEIFTAKPKKLSNPTPQTTSKSDNEIINKIKSAKNADKFNSLMSGDWSAYPSQSEAESALAWIIAFYTHDTDQIESIMKSSSLVRDKWEKNKSYLSRTIGNAVGNVSLGLATINTVRKKEEKEDDKKEQILTDYGNAESLIEISDGNFQYSYGSKDWYVWNSITWITDKKGEILRMAKKTVRENYKRAGDCEDDKQRKAIASHARKSESARAIQAMITLAQSEPGIAIELNQFDTNKWLFNCNNGTLNLKTGKLQLHDRKDLITKLAPVEYDSNAKLKLWDDFLDTATKNDKELQSYLQRAVGYSLTGEVSEEKIFFISGAAGTGKSTFIEAIKSTLGDYAQTADFETFISKNSNGNARNDIAALVGARFVSSIEVEKGKRLAEGLVKLITGGDTVTARFLYQEYFSFIPQFKLWLVANDKPKIDSEDDGMWRRIIPINFDHAIPEGERDPAVKETLKNPEIAGPAILAWAMQGCLMWQEQGLKITESIKQNRTNYKTEMDYVKQYVDEYCELDESSVVVKQALYIQYQQWCKNSGIKGVLSMIMFGKKLKNAFPNVKEEKIGHDGERVWFGLRINKHLIIEGKNQDLFSYS